jgi:hypothetical protein
MQGDVNKIFFFKSLLTPIFCLYTSRKLSRQKFEFSLKVKVNPGYLLISFLLYLLTWIIWTCFSSDQIHNEKSNKNKSPSYPSVMTHFFSQKKNCFHLYQNMFQRYEKEVSFGNSNFVEPFLDFFFTRKASCQHLKIILY